jgi:hypothetical protein
MLMTVPVASDGLTFQPGVPKTLFQTALHTLYPRLRKYGVSRDGDRFLITVSDNPGAAPAIAVVWNWQEELKPRVPTR